MASCFGAKVKVPTSLHDCVGLLELSPAACLVSTVFHMNKVCQTNLNPSLGKTSHLLCNCLNYNIC